MHTLHVQVYVRSELSCDMRQAAQQALLTHCTPLLNHHSSTASDSNSEDSSNEPSIASQLSLYKPCAWPHLVTASHFASSSHLAALARDAALWECFCAEVATTQLSMLLSPEQLADAQQAGNPLLHSLLPATALPAECQDDAPTARLQLVGVHGPKQSQLLCMLWHAAGCFAEQADWRDAEARAIWSANHAQSLQV